MDKYVEDSKARNCFLDEFDSIEHKIVFTLEDALYNVENKLQAKMGKKAGNPDRKVKKTIRKKTDKKRP